MARPELEQLTRWASCSAAWRAGSTHRAAGAGKAVTNRHSIKTVQAQLGHRSKQSTHMYAHLGSREHSRVVESLQPSDPPHGTLTAPSKKTGTQRDHLVPRIIGCGGPLRKALSSGIWGHFGGCYCCVGGSPAAMRGPSLRLRLKRPKPLLNSSGAVALQVLPGQTTARSVRCFLAWVQQNSRGWSIGSSRRGWGSNSDRRHRQAHCAGCPSGPG